MISSSYLSTSPKPSRDASIELLYRIHTVALILGMTTQPSKNSRNLTMLTKVANFCKQLSPLFHLPPFLSNEPEEMCVLPPSLSHFKFNCVWPPLLVAFSTLCRVSNPRSSSLFHPSMCWRVIIGWTNFTNQGLLTLHRMVNVASVARSFIRGAGEGGCIVSETRVGSGSLVPRAWRGGDTRG